MFLFKRILSFAGAEVAPADKRAAQRFTVGHPFPFKTILTLMAHDGEGRLMSNDEAGQDWAGRLVNLSASGASIQIHSAAAGLRGERCRFKLSLDDYLLDIPGAIAHFRCMPQHALCGISFDFGNVELKKAYLQLLEPVSIGALLVPVDAKKVKQDAAGLFKEQYRSNAATMLTVWRSDIGGPINSFDFRMNDYGVRWSEGMTEVEPYGMAQPNSGGRKTTSPFVKLTEAQLEEVRWLFCLSVPNLPKAVAFDVRKFLEKLVA